VIALAKEEQAYFLYFNPEDKQWEQLANTDLPKAVTDDIPFDERDIDDQLRQHYDDQDLEPAGHPNDPILGVVEHFPKKPMTEPQIAKMQDQHPMIGEVMPLINAADGEGTIALIFFYDDIIGEQRITAATGYEPETDEWQVIASADSADPDLDQALEQLQAAYVHWVDYHYTMDEIQPIEDPEAAIKS
jgi:hypothetical protein